MSDTARKRQLADWVVNTKKQVVKTYAVAKWARDADTVQKCMVRLRYLCTINVAEPFVCTRVEYHCVSHESQSTI